MGNVERRKAKKRASRRGSLSNEGQGKANQVVIPSNASQHIFLRLLIDLVRFNQHHETIPVATYAVVQPSPFQYLISATILFQIRAISSPTYTYNTPRFLAPLPFSPNNHWHSLIQAHQTPGEAPTLALPTLLLRSKTLSKRPKIGGYCQQRLRKDKHKRTERKIMHVTLILRCGFVSNNYAAEALVCLLQRMLLHIGVRVRNPTGWNFADNYVQFQLPPSDREIHHTPEHKASLCQHAAACRTDHQFSYNTNEWRTATVILVLRGCPCNYTLITWVRERV